MRCLYIVLLIAIIYVPLVLCQECTACPCLSCTFTKTGNYFQNCGGNNTYGEFPASSKAIIYTSGCQPCTTDRFMGRLTSPSHAEWGFMAKGDISCTGYDEIRKDVPPPSCPSPGTYKITTSRTLRPQPEGLVCGTFAIGDTLTLEKCDPSSAWCYGQGHGQLCGGQNMCPNCYGWVECNAI